MSKLIIKTNNPVEYSGVIDKLVKRGFTESASIVPYSVKVNYIQVETDYYLYNRVNGTTAEMLGYIEAGKIKI